MFGKILLSYLAVLVFPLLTGAFIYARTVAMVEKDLEDTNSAILAHSRDLIDESLMETDRMISALAFDRNILSFITMGKLGEGSPEIAKVKDAWERLGSFRFRAAVVKDVMIASRTSGLVISGSLPFARDPLFYGILFRIGGVDAAQWARDYLHRPHVREYVPCRQVDLVNESFPAIACLQSIPLDLPHDAPGLVVTLIDAREIEKHLSKLRLGESGSAFIADTNGTVIASLSAVADPLRTLVAGLAASDGVLKRRLGETDMLISYSTSPFNGWRYVAAIPTDFVMAKVIYIKRILGVFLAVSAAAGLALTFLFSYRQAKPMSDILNMLHLAPGGSPRGHSELDFLRGSVSELIATNQKMKATLEEHLPIMQDGFLRRLFEGAFRDQEELAATMEHVGLRMPDGSFAIALFRASASGTLVSPRILTELDASRVVAKEVMGRHLPQPVRFLDIDERTTALLVCFETKDAPGCRADLLGALGAAARELLETCNLPVVVGVGGFYSSLSDVHFSCAEAAHALEHARFLAPGTPIWHADVPKAADTVSFPIEIESRLVNLMKLGRARAAAELLERLFTENFEKRGLGGEKADRLFELLCRMVERYTEQNGIPVDTAFLRASVRAGGSVRQIAERINECVARCCALALDKKDADETIMKDAIVEFVRSSYMDPGLCLYSLASRFHYSESYLYHFFVHRVGLSFSAYLERIRMRHARDHLSNPEIPIESVAARCGYASARSFRRAFKRAVGVLPSAYRELAGIESVKSGGESWQPGLSPP